MRTHLHEDFVTFPSAIVREIIFDRREMFFLLQCHLLSTLSFPLLSTLLSPLLPPPLINSIQLNCICLALDHHYSLKGLNRPNIYDTPLYPSPHKGKKILP